MGWAGFDLKEQISVTQPGGVSSPGSMTTPQVYMVHPSGGHCGPTNLRKVLLSLS